ncbi:MAG: HAD hydrolase family protein, partial [Giesbergeria sp.]|nr:HAD hydrolase family protein [Giesbergeria sp.]
MAPLTDWPAAARAGMVGLFTDIDDTLTTDGRITPDALDALGALKAAGLHVIPITGRPVGWSAPFAATWPVDAIVAENGAVALLNIADNLDQNCLQRLSGKREQLSKIYQQDAAIRADNFRAMQQVLAQIEGEVPGARRATDSPGRETDIAIDHSEFTHLPQEAIDHAVRIMRAAGMTAT